jgi:catechol 2,3-dioxygenase-like lactoylglutathione lyase family enzyme
MGRLSALFLMSMLPLTAQTMSVNSTGVAMGHLHIITPDPAAHKRIWVDVLGGKLVNIGPLEFAKFPGVFVGFRKGESNGGTEASVVDHLGFLVKDLNATREKIKGAGLPVVRELPATKQFFAMLPDSVKVEFTEDTTIDVPIRHHHIHFASDQIDTMREWYVKTFGAVAGMRAKFKAADLPGVNLSWNPAEKPLAPTKGRALDHIGFEVANVEEFCRKLETAGMKLDVPITKLEKMGLTVAFVVDPYGTRIELTQGLNKY